MGVMDIYGTVIDEYIEAFLTAAPRYKLVVVAADASNTVSNSVDIGRELSLVICGMYRSDDTSFQFAVQDAIDGIFSKNVCCDAKFGKYIILENPGILFEPALNIDVCTLLKSISRNTLVILLWPGVIRPDRLCFLSETSDLYINQSEINYAII